MHSSLILILLRPFLPNDGLTITEAQVIVHAGSLSCLWWPIQKSSELCGTHLHRETCRVLVSGCPACSAHRPARARRSYSSSAGVGISLCCLTFRPLLIDGGLQLSAIKVLEHDSDHPNSQKMPHPIKKMFYCLLNDLSLFLLSIKRLCSQLKQRKSN